MFKPYLKSIVRNGGKGRMGLGIELFRLDAVDEEELTAEEKEIADESKEEASSTAVMRIYENIGEDFWTGGGVTAKKFSDELNSFGDIKRLNVHINCLGGDVFTAQAINAIISDHDSKKTCYIDGVCASAATLIACAADEVIARHNTNYMLHYPWCFAIGNADTMRKAAEDLEKITIPIVSVYKEQVKGKIDEEKIRGLMEDETWLTPDEALEYGFVNKVRGKIKAIAKVGKHQILCSGKLMDVGRYHYRNVPDYPEAKAKIEHQQKETNKMTEQEIEPELLASIQAKAKADERTRLAELDAMDGPGLGGIIAEAKADGRQPKDIAMECFNVAKDQLTAANVTNALARDARPAGDITAGDAPHRKPEAKKDKVQALIMNAFKAQRPKVAPATTNNGN